MTGYKLNFMFGQFEYVYKSYISYVHLKGCKEHRILVDWDPVSY